MMPLTRILYLIDRLSPGGAERQFMELLKRIREYDVVPIICTMLINCEGYEDFCKEKGITHYKLIRRGPVDLKVMRELSRIADSEQVAVLHSWGKIASTIGVFVSKWTGVPIVCSSIRDTPGKMSLKIYLSKELHLLLGDIVVSNTFSGIKATYSNWRTKFRVVPNGIDLSRFSDLDEGLIGAIRKKFKCDDRFNIGMVANLRAERDPFTLIKSAQLLRRYMDAFNVFIIGEGPQKQDLERWIKDLSLQDIVHVLGFQRNVEEYISVFDVSVLLLNSEVIQEGLSNFLLESMALRKVVVATRGGGNLELIKEGVTGYLVEAANEKELCDILIKIKNSDRKTMTDNAYKLLVDKFDMRKYVSSYHDIYAELLGC